MKAVQVIFNDMPTTHQVLATFKLDGDKVVADYNDQMLKDRFKNGMPVFNEDGSFNKLVTPDDGEEFLHALFLNFSGSRTQAIEMV